MIATPGRCWLPGESKADGQDSRDGRYWGVAAQAYLLRSERNWGIGDYTDLRR